MSVVMPFEPPTASGSQSVEDLRRELAEARDQQAATAEILAAISSSTTDPHGVFEKIVTSAARLCNADNAGVFRLDGDRLRLVGRHGPMLVGQGTRPLTRKNLLGRAVLDRQTLHVVDLQAETHEYPEGAANARRLGFRALLAL